MNELRRLCAVYVVGAVAVFFAGGTPVYAQGLVPPAEMTEKAAPVDVVEPTSADVPAPAAEVNPYNVTGLVIDTTAENAVVARGKAFSDALSTGFAKVLEAVVPDMAARERMTPPTEAELGAMLQDFTTSNEQLSATRYTATYDMRFKPASVQAYVARTIAPAAAPATDAPTTATPAQTSVPVVASYAAQNPSLVPPRRVEMHVRFITLAQWQTVRAQLMTTPGVKSVQIIALKTDMARINVVYDSTEEALVAAIRLRGMAIQLAPTSDTIASGQTVYDIALPATVGGM